MWVGFTVLGKPKGKARARTSFNNGKVHAYTPKITTDYEENVRTSYWNAVRHKFAKKIPLEATILAFYAIPKSSSRKIKEEMLNGDILPTIKPDCDNVIKIILDALNQVTAD